MAIAPETIQQLYKTYLGRELTPQQMAEVQSPTGKYAKFDTPEKLETLLGSTSNSLKNRTLSKIDQNINNLKSGTNLFGGKLPDYLTYQQQNPELQQANQELDTATSGYDLITQRAGAAPSKTVDLLKAGSQFFGDSYEDINKRYSDPNSAWYISDPQLRRGVVDNATKSKSAAMESVVSKIQDIYGVLTTAAQNQLASKSEKVQTLLKGVEKSYDALMAYYGQEKADEEARKTAEIEHGYRMQEIAAQKSGNDNLSIADLVNLQKNPLVMMQQAGYTRKLAPDGGPGFWFYDSNGNAVTADDVANAIGANKADLLIGSTNPEDQKLIQSSKPLSAAAAQARTSAISGLNNVRQISDLLDSNMSILSKIGTQSPFGLGQGNSQVYRNARKEISDVLARLRTGAAINAAEEKLYASFIPNPLVDTATSQKDKLARLTFIFSSIANGGKPSENIINQVNEQNANSIITTSDGMTWRQNSDGTFESL